MVKIRRAYEALFLGLFLFFLLITDLRYLKGWPVSLFLEATPLCRGLDRPDDAHPLSQPDLGPRDHRDHDDRSGRVWCNWMCPFGSCTTSSGVIGNRRNTKQMIEVNRYRKIYALKYYILAAMLAMAGLWIIPTTLSAPGRIYAAYRGKELPQRGVGPRLRRNHDRRSARRPRSTRRATARCKSACSTRSR